MTAERMVKPPCRCRTCIAKSLARALRQIDQGRPMLAASIVLLIILDLTEDAVFVRTGPRTKAPLCEHDPRHKTAKMFRDAGVELVAGDES